MIKLALMPYCDDCPYFEVDVEKPEKIQRFVFGSDEIVEMNRGDTYIQCKNREICKKIKLYLDCR